METLTYQHREHHQVQPDNWLYEIKQKGNSQTCYVMVQNVKVRTSTIYRVVALERLAMTETCFLARRHLNKLLVYHAVRV